jgi:hypothetical protein
VRNSVLPTVHMKLFFFFWPFRFHRTGLSGTLRSAFSSFFLCAAGLRGTFPGHPHPPSLLLFSFWTTQHEIQHKHPWEAIRPGIRTLLTSRWCRESVALPSTTLPSAPSPLLDIHTHPAEFPSFEKILPLRWDSNPLAPGPRPRSTVSDSHAATELPFI